MACAVRWHTKIFLFLCLFYSSWETGVGVWKWCGFHYVLNRGRGRCVFMCNKLSSEQEDQLDSHTQLPLCLRPRFAATSNANIRQLMWCRDTRVNNIQRNAHLRYREKKIPGIPFELILVSYILAYGCAHW